MNNITENDSKNSETEKVGCIDNQRLKNLRIRKKVSQAELAKKIGTSLQGISRLERFPTVSTTKTLVKLAQYFEVPCGYLLGETEIELPKYAADDQLAKKLRQLLDKIIAVDRDVLASTINDFILLLETKPKLMERAENIVYEEEILGLWWSIISAYQQCDWDTMIKRSDRLIELAGGLRRPYLVALGMSYKAKALRNHGTASEVKQAEAILEKIEKDVDVKSALTHRMRGKIFVREDKFNEALKEYFIAQNAVECSTREDALFLLEKTKLYRNISTAHQRLATENEKAGKEQERAEHLKQARIFMNNCKESISELEKCIPDESKVEELLLCSCEANFHESSKELGAAIRYAKKTLDMAIELQKDNFAIRTRMHLFYLNMMVHRIQDAMKYLAQLFPLERYRQGPFARHYQKFVKKYENEIEKYVREQMIQVKS